MKPHNLLFLIVITTTPLLTTTTHTFGNYTVPQTSEECLTIKSNYEKISKSTLSTKLQTMKNYFPFATKKAEELYREGFDSTVSSIVITTLIYFSPLVLIAFFSLVMTPLIFIYFFCNKCSRIFQCLVGNYENEIVKLGDDKETVNLKNKNRKRREQMDYKLSSTVCRNFVYCCSSILAILIILLAIPWTVFQFSAKNGIEKAECFMNKAFDVVEHGMIEDHSEIVGANGMKYALEIFEEEFQNFEQLEVEKLDLILQEFDQNPELKNFDDNISGKFQEYFEVFQDRFVDSCSRENITVLPNIVKELEKFISPNIESEISELKMKMENLKAGTLVLRKIFFEDPSSQENYEKIFTQMKENMDQMRVGVDSMREKIPSSKTLQIWRYIISWYVYTFCIIFISILLLYLLMLSFSHNSTKALNVSDTKKYKKNLKIVKFALKSQGCISMTMMIIAIIFNFSGVFNIVTGALGFTLCSLGDKILDDREIRNIVSHQNFRKLNDFCLVSHQKNANLFFSSDVLESGESQRQQYENLMEIIMGFNWHFKKNFDISTSEEQEHQLSSLKNYESQLLLKFYFPEKDFENSFLDDPLKVIEGMNKELQCINDEVQANYTNCTIGALVSVENDEYNKSFSEGYCMLLSKFPSGKLKNRLEFNKYVLLQNCSITDQKIQELLANYSSLEKGLNSHSTLLGYMVANFSEKIYQPVSNIFACLERIEDQITHVRSKIPRTLEIFEGRKIDKVFKCDIMEDILLDSIGSTCVYFIGNYGYAGIVMALMGPLMTVFSCLACLSTTQKDLEKKREGYMKKEEAILNEIVKSENKETINVETEIKNNSQGNQEIKEKKDINESDFQRKLKIESIQEVNESKEDDEDYGKMEKDEILELSKKSFGLGGDLGGIGNVGRVGITGGRKRATPNMEFRDKDNIQVNKKKGILGRMGFGNNIKKKKKDVVHSEMESSGFSIFNSENKESRLMKDNDRNKKNDLNVIPENAYYTSIDEFDESSLRIPQRNRKLRRIVEREKILKSQGL